MEGEPLRTIEKMFEEFMFALNADFNVFGKMINADG